jgi:hypothetical protein
VSVDVYFDGRVHANDTETTDDFRAVGHLLRPEEELRCVVFPAFVETIETVRGESD